MSGEPEDPVETAEWEALKVDNRPTRAEVHKVGWWTYRIRVYSDAGWLPHLTEYVRGRSWAQRRADTLIAEGRQPTPQPVYVTSAAGEPDAFGAAYLIVDPTVPTPVHRTVEVDDHTRADLGADCRIHGVERIGGPVDRNTLAAVLRHCRWETTP